MCMKYIICMMCMNDEHVCIHKFILICECECGLIYLGKKLTDYFRRLFRVFFWNYLY